MDLSGTNHISLLLLQLLFSVEGSDNNACYSLSIHIGLIHKDEVIYRISPMMCPTDSPLAVDNEISLNGVISQ